MVIGLAALLGFENMSTVLRFRSRWKAYLFLSTCILGVAFVQHLSLLASDGVVIQEGEGVAGLQIGSSTLKDAVLILGNPLSQKQIKSARNVVFPQHLSLSFGANGRLNTVSTLPGFTGKPSRGIRHGDSAQQVVSRYGAPQQQSRQTSTYPDVIFCKNNDGSVVKMVAWQRPNRLRWSRLPDHPTPFGVAGPIVGVHGDVLLTAGGANFPDGLPWHPTKSGGVSHKKYWANIQALSNDRAGWRNAGALPAAIGYSVSVSTPNGILSLGGERSEPAPAGSPSLKRLDTVFRIVWDPESRTAAVKTDWPVGGTTTASSKLRQLPPLTKATTAACGAVVGQYVYLAGGDSGEGGSPQFLRLSLMPPADGEWGWETLPTWPGAPRSHAIGVGQDGKFFLISGRNKLADRDFEILTDAYAFDPEKYGSNGDESAWRRIADVSLGGKPVSVMAGAGIAAPHGAVTVIGGASGEVLLQKEVEIPRLIARAKSAGEAKRVVELEKQATDLYDFHKGFSRDLLVYDIDEDKWHKVGEMPVTGPVTTTAVLWQGAVVVPSGERSPGVRTRSVWKLDGYVPQ